MKIAPGSGAERRRNAEAAASMLNLPEAIVEYERSMIDSGKGADHACLAELLLEAGFPQFAFIQWATAVNKSWANESDSTSPKSNSNVVDSSSTSSGKSSAAKQAAIPEVQCNVSDNLKYPEGNAGLSKCHQRLGDVLLQYSNAARELGEENIARVRLVYAGIEYRRAVQFNPSNEHAIAGLLDVACRAVAINPCAENRLLLAGAYFLAGETAEARKQVEICAALKPGDEDINIALKMMVAEH